jgi:hypothetical protein
MRQSLSRSISDTWQIRKLVDQIGDRRTKWM